MQHADGRSVGRSLPSSALCRAVGSETKQSQEHAFRNTRRHDSDAQLRSAPVAALGVVPKQRASAQTLSGAQYRAALDAAESTDARTAAYNAPDGVARAQADPLRDGAVLLLLLPQNALDLERLVRRLRGGSGCVSVRETVRLWDGPVRPGGAARQGERRHSEQIEVCGTRPAQRQRPESTCRTAAAGLQPGSTSARPWMSSQAASAGAARRSKP